MVKSVGNGNKVAAVRQSDALEQVRGSRCIILVRAGWRRFAGDEKGTRAQFRLCGAKFRLEHGI